MTEYKKLFQNSKALFFNDENTIAMSTADTRRCSLPSKPTNRLHARAVTKTVKTFPDL